MEKPAQIRGLTAFPEAVVAAWPADWPLAALWSGAQETRSRWTVLARPGGDWVAGSGDELRRIVTPGMSPALRPNPAVSPSRNPRDSLRGASAHPARQWGPGWIGWLSYDAGRVLEPRAALGSGAAGDRAWPLAHFARVDDALVYDHAAGHWLGFGAWHELAAGVADSTRNAGLEFELPEPRSQMGQERYERAVERALEYIRAGDVYQVNLAHRLTAAFQGSARGLFLRLMATAQPWYGGYCELTSRSGDARAIASASPELFLEFDAATRRVVTRPMKGTRPGGADPCELAAAEKDRAELNMIVDLMRNDLGRVCEFGSVRVERREVERHGRAGQSGEVPKWQSGKVVSEGGLLQATATVSGRVREGLGIADVLAATFPGGSITGAPKIRAMQIIDELEPVKRGPYCGAFGWIGDDGSAAFNIMIRTALLGGEAAGPSRAQASLIRNGTLDYSVGAGIVADSDPRSEWEETMQKAGVMRAVADG